MLPTRLFRSRRTFAEAPAEKLLGRLQKEVAASRALWLTVRAARSLPRSFGSRLLSGSYPACWRSILLSCIDLRCRLPSGHVSDDECDQGLASVKCAKSEDPGCARSDGGAHRPRKQRCDTGSLVALLLNRRLSQMRVIHTQHITRISTHFTAQVPNESTNKDGSGERIAILFDGDDATGRSFDLREVCDNQPALFTRSARFLQPFLATARIVRRAIRSPYESTVASELAQRVKMCSTR